MVVSDSDQFISLYLFVVFDINVCFLICLASGKSSVKLCSQFKHEEDTEVSVTAK